MIMEQVQTGASGAVTGDFNFIDPEGLVSILNRASHYDIEVEAERFQDKTPRNDPWIRRAMDAHVEIKGKYDLTIVRESGGIPFLPCLDIGSEKELGYLFVRRSYENWSTDEPTIHEEIILRFKRGLPLLYETIPPCSVKIHVTSPEWNPLEVNRKDHIKRAKGIIAVRKDLSYFLPTKWFIRDSFR